MRGDLALRGGRVLDVFSGRFRTADVLIGGGRIIGFGADARRSVNVDGTYLVPGLIDTHVHIESSQLSPASFAHAVLPHGTTTVIADPHEIANVLGVDGVRQMLADTEGLALRVFFMAPSCVPASPFETSGARIGAEEIALLLGWERVLGLGEVMNYPGVVRGDPEVMAKLRAARGRPIDGHAPGLRGDALATYIAAGPQTDHECSTLAEAEEKLSAGMHILIREGSAARNLDELLPLLTERTAPFVHFCTDDRHAETILREGHIDGMIRRAVAAGIPAETAVAAATIHAARAYGIQGIGAIAPGYAADLLVLSDLKTFAICDVYAGGRRVDGDGGPASGTSPAARNSLCIRLPETPFRIPAAPRGVVRALVAHPEGLVTDEERVSPRVVDGDVVADPARDLLKLAVVERHRGTGRVGVGLVRGFGLSSGALASTVAHDSHNLIVVGTDDVAMRTAVRRLSELGGGQVIVDGDRVVAELALPIAGLMSPRPIEEVAAAQTRLEAAAHALGCRLPSPFMTLSFLALPVIPHLKLTDRGWVDVDRFEIVPLYVDEDARRSRTT
ncbi:MAG: adenine deaminase [Candidatus Bipolaricaulis sp.]|nr:adenine deaminase [Candidatus Bipolaricaulis sp.]